MTTDRRSDHSSSAWHQLRRHLKLQRNSTYERSVTREEAEWFLSLPDKIKRRHFTADEQIWMRRKSELIMGQSSRTESGRPVTAPSSSPPTLPAINSTISLPVHECFELPAEVPADFGRSEMEQWPLKLHPPIASSPSLAIQKPSPSMQSCESSSSFGGLPTSQPTTQSTRRSPPSPINTSTAIYIGDPENMTKIRQYLSSPLLPHPTSAPCKSHFDHSFFEVSRDEDYDDASSSTDFNDPVTPDDSKLGHAKSSYFSLTTPLHSPAHTPGISPFDDLLRSDTTLKLTLTRPDIRSDDFCKLRKDASRVPELHRPIDEMDPLALDPLPFSDDATGQHGPFANEQAVGKKRLKAIFGGKKRQA